MTQYSDGTVIISSLIYHLINEAEANKEVRAIAKENLSRERYNREYVFSSIRLPRQSGHTTAVINVLKNRPEAVAFTDLAKLRHHRLAPSNFRSIESEKWGKKSPEITAIHLRGEGDIVMFDSVANLVNKDLDLIMHQYLPKIVLFLGDCSGPAITSIDY